MLIAISLAAARNPRLAAVAGVLYAVLMGFWMGSISQLYETYYDGIVGQALLASVTTFLAALLLYSSRAIRVTGKFVKIVVVATAGIALMYLVGLVFSLFGIDLLFCTQPNGLGIAISALVCLLAAANLLVDFAVIEGGQAARQLQPSALRRRLIGCFATAESQVMRRDLSASKRRYVFVRLLIDRGRDVRRLFLRALWPEREWLIARYQRYTLATRLRHLVDAARGRL